MGARRCASPFIPSLSSFNRSRTLTVSLHCLVHVAVTRQTEAVSKPCAPANNRCRIAYAQVRSEGD